MSLAFSRRLALALLCCLPTISLAQEEGIAEAVVESNAAAASPDNAKPSARPITVAVSLADDNTIITGTLTETTSISIKTAFGVAELPLGEVAGIRFPRNDDTSTTVVMLNGDSITGATDVKFANVETTWGNAKINGQSIASMLMVPGLTWQATDVLGTKRWQLIEAPRSQSQPGGSPNPQAMQGARPTPSAPRSGSSASGSPATGQPLSQPIRINN